MNEYFTAVSQYMLKHAEAIPALREVLRKAVWSTAYVNDLADSNFLYILPGGKKDSDGKTTPRSLRMFPYKDANGKIDLPHLRNAIARIPQSNRIDSATKERLQKKAQSLLGGAKEKAFESSAYFLKDTNGEWWFIGVYSNKFEDRQDTILSSESHENFTSFVDKSGFKPVVTLWHEPRMSEKFWLTIWRTFYSDIDMLQSVVDTVFKTAAIAKTEQVLYLNGFALVVAKVLPDKVAVAERLSKQKKLGMSHGFVSGALDDNIIDRYFSFEFTVLPRHRAANAATTGLFSEMREKSNMAIDLEKRQFLENAFGPGIVETLEAETRENEEALELLLRFKDQIEEETMTDSTQLQTEVAEETPQETTEPVVENSVETTAPSDDTAQPVTMQQMMEFMAPLRDLVVELRSLPDEVRALRESDEQKTQVIQNLTRELEVLRKGDDERIAEQITPANFWGIKQYQASKAADNIVPESEVKTKEEPKVPDAQAASDSPFATLMTMALASTK